jgi:hypothetical protein
MPNSELFVDGSGYLLISAVVVAFASMMSLIASRKSEHWHHRLSKIRGGDVAFPGDSKGLPDAIVDLDHYPKPNQNLLRFATMVLVEDLGLDGESKKARPSKKSYICYF